MSRELAISIGQHSDAGRKETNQDAHGVFVPQYPELATKGIAVALADGISTSAVSALASQSAIKSFLTDYYCTSDSWSVKTAGERVISATNSWLHGQSGRSLHAGDPDKGYVCTFSALVLKSRTAYIFHIGDSRIYRLSGRSLEQLTTDHRITVSSQESYLARALGADANVEIDYLTQPLRQGDIFILATDGIYEHVDQATVAGAIEDHADDLNSAARQIVEAAYEHGSTDNLTIQIIRVESLPEGQASELMDTAEELPPAPLLEPRSQFEGYEILRQVHASSRSHIYLARDIDSDAVVILKVPSIDMRGDPAYLKRFMMEEWIARRIDNAHVLKAFPHPRERGHLYVLTEYVDGQTLTQWMRDHPEPDLESVRRIAEQIAVGLRAFHRKEMLHQDLRPENIMIDKAGTVKIIDFGSTWVAGVAEASPASDQDDILGTAQFTAPEYFLGEGGSSRSDLFSLGVIVYQMLTGKLPYGTQVANMHTKVQQRKLHYASASQINPAVPDWMDAALAKALQIDPQKRHEVLSEFTHDLRHPNRAFVRTGHRPLAESNPVLLWKVISAVLLIIVVGLLWRAGM